MKKVKEFTEKLALNTGKLIKNNLGKVKKIDYKGEINIVTDVDLKAEDFIIKAIQKQYPEHSILSEEIGNLNKKAEYKWIIDPLDGTTNFSHSFPFFCVSIALEKGKDIILGVVYDPMRDELFYAEKDKGAYLNKKKIAVSSISQLSKSLLATGFAYNIHKAKKNNNINYFRKFLKTAQAIRRAGSAALDLAYVSCGRFDGYWELNLSPWDTAAGYLLVCEAGGKVTDFSGQRFLWYNKEVLATNKNIHSSCLEILLPEKERKHRVLRNSL